MKSADGIGGICNGKACYHSRRFTLGVSHANEKQWKPNHAVKARSLGQISNLLYDAGQCVSGICGVTDTKNNGKMQNIVKKVKNEIETLHGKLERVGDGRSLFCIPKIDAFIYFRYSKIMKNARPYAFFGLRKKDVDLARGHDFHICFVTDSPGFIFSIPFADFEACYDYVNVGDDNQYKTHLFFKKSGAELYIPKSGRFAADSYRGLPDISSGQDTFPPSPIDHSGAQTLIGAVGALKGYNVWFPKTDIDKIDRDVMDFSFVCRKLPSYDAITDAVFQEIDVIWLHDHKPVSLFEVEHSTPIYSGLLRINDILLASSNAIDAKIVAEQDRRDTFQRQIRRPTFSAHRLEEKVSFISYDNIWRWREALRNNIHE